MNFCIIYITTYAEHLGNLSIIISRMYVSIIRDVQLHPPVLHQPYMAVFSQ